MSKEQDSTKKHPFFQLPEKEQFNILKVLESNIKSIKTMEIISNINVMLDGLSERKKNQINAQLLEGLKPYSANDLKQNKQAIINNITTYFNNPVNRMPKLTRSLLGSTGRAISKALGTPTVLDPKKIDLTNLLHNNAQELQQSSFPIPTSDQDLQTIISDTPRAGVILTQMIEMSKKATSIANAKEAIITPGSSSPISVNFAEQESVNFAEQESEQKNDKIKQDQDKAARVLQSAIKKKLEALKNDREAGVRLGKVAQTLSELANDASNRVANSTKRNDNLPPPPNYPPPIPPLSPREATELEQKAATKIQALVRGKQTRDRLDEYLDSLPEGELEKILDSKRQFYSEQKAATKIQALVRGKQTRDKLDEYLDSLPEGELEKILDSKREALVRYEEARGRLAEVVGALTEIAKDASGHVTSSMNKETRDVYGKILPPKPNNPPPPPPQNKNRVGSPER